jgi:hypothetical protein
MTPDIPPLPASRRRFLGQAGATLGAAALASLLGTGGARAATPKSAIPSPRGIVIPRARRIIYLTQAGAPSHLDLFDPKPGLKARFREDLPDSIRGTQRLTGMTSGQKTFPIAPSPFAFRPAGRSGLLLSELLPHTARVADELTPP